MGNQSSTIINENLIEDSINTQSITSIVNSYASQFNSISSGKNKFIITASGSIVEDVNVSQTATVTINTKAMAKQISSSDVSNQLQESIKRDLFNKVESSKKGLAVLTSSLSKTVDQLKSTIDSVVDVQINNTTLTEIFNEASAENLAMIQAYDSTIRNVKITQTVQLKHITDQMINNVAESLSNTKVVKDINEKIRRKTEINEDLDPAPIAVGFGFGIGLIILIIIGIILVVIFIYFSPTLIPALTKGFSKQF